MRAFIGGLAFVVLAAVTSGCASDKDASSSGKQVQTIGSAKACVMKSGGQDVLRLMVPADTACTPKDGSLRLESHDHDVVNVWLVPGVRTVDDAVGHIPLRIDSEFRNFRTTSTTGLTVAGAPAKHLLGSGTEADDGDPGSADVVVFQTGDHVFVACTHGEALTSSAQRSLLALVQTAQKP